MGEEEKLRSKVSRLDRHETNLPEGIHKVFHLRAKYWLISIRYGAYPGISLEAPFNQRCPLFSIDQRRALGAGVPDNAAKIGRVLAQEVVIPTKIAA